MPHPAQTNVYKNPSVTLNKSVLNWTQVRQLHWKTQLHENSFMNTHEQTKNDDKKFLRFSCELRFFFFLSSFLQKIFDLDDGFCL